MSILKNIFKSEFNRIKDDLINQNQPEFEIKQFKGPRTDNYTNTFNILTWFNSDYSLFIDVLIQRFSGYDRMNDAVAEEDSDYSIQISVGQGPNDFYDKRWNSLNLNLLFPEYSDSFKFDNYAEYSGISKELSSAISKALNLLENDFSTFEKVLHERNNNQSVMTILSNEKLSEDAKDLEAKNSYYSGRKRATT